MAARKTHGMSNTRLYRIHRAMIQRCTKENFAGFKDYGAKGITICDDWMDGFEHFMKWSLSNGYSDELTIDRINPKGNYEPSNCRWVTQHEQILNQDRNKSRRKEDKYIKILDDGRWFLNIQKRINGRSVSLYSMTCISRKEAVEARDMFLNTGKKTEIEKHEFGTTKKSEFGIDKKRRIDQKRRKEARLILKNIA